ncbi:MAG TPA: hypothetical protein VF331_15385 [Polyangiales bacterium]
MDTPTGDGGAIQPGLELSLSQRLGSSKLCDLSGGKVRGTMDGLFPFEADVTGTLDCSTGKLTGKLLNGWYLVLGTKYYFGGDLTADYNKTARQYVSGKWIATEPPVDGGFPWPQPPGGSGDWNANWVR